ncbi:energy-coupling factor transport system substrate-specific component [Brevibacterium siliguriense]|uniref:Energy-coupling factor transport system substrate-specific component n=1 Tax=Brevibacterium siliguriense TaxID=1136497 RepID=A0A1H1VM42_9MICO|nr:energy-coupling factor transport system substrate-specific component [Brevibacterium siliguriense]
MTAHSRQSGQGPTTSVGPGQNHNRTLPLTLTLLGTLIVIGTYVAVLLTQPANLDVDLGYTTLWVMLGYLGGGILLAAGTLPLIPRSVLALIPVAIALNVVIGQVIGNYTPVPLYLDSIGTVLIGVLAGPAAGAFTGIISNLIWGVTLSPSVIAFSSGAAFIGAAAGWAARLGVFRTPWTAIIVGAIAGVPAGAIGAPVAAYVFGGGLGPEPGESSRSSKRQDSRCSTPPSRRAWSPTSSTRRSSSPSPISSFSRCRNASSVGTSSSPTAGPV